MAHQQRHNALNTRVTRRGFGRTCGVAAGWWALGGLRGLTTAEVRGDTAVEPVPTPGGFRIVHFTDAHIQPEMRADQGVAAAFKAAHALNPRPDFILGGGDMVHNARGSDEPRARTLYDLFTSVTRDSDLPFHHCVGNHDVFGWTAGNKVDPSHVQYGKRMMQDRLGLAETNYSFDHKGWRFCVLDNIQPAKTARGYEGRLLDDALAHLEASIDAAAGRPMVVCTHIPLLAGGAAPLIESALGAAPLIESALGAAPKTPPGLICANGRAVMARLSAAGVPLVLTGHLHLRETLRAGATIHLGQGAVCGNWWRGPNRATPEGFGVLDLFPDGRFEEHYHVYGWQA